jgi:hypothetical protein
MDYYFGYIMSVASEQSDFFTAINVQAQTANIFSRLFAFETARWPLET